MEGLGPLFGWFRNIFFHEFLVSKSTKISRLNTNVPLDLLLFDVIFNIPRVIHPFTLNYQILRFVFFTPRLSKLKIFWMRNQILFLRKKLFVLVFVTKRKNIDAFMDSLNPTCNCNKESSSNSVFTLSSLP